MGGKGLGPRLPRACATYHVSESGFPLLHKGATNAHVPELHVTVPDSSLKIIKRLHFILIYCILQMWVLRLRDINNLPMDISRKHLV